MADTLVGNIGNKPNFSLIDVFLKKIPDAKGRPVVKVVPCPEDLFDDKVDAGRDYEIFKIGPGNVYFLDFVAISVQNEAFNRIAAFIELKDYAGTILDDKKLKDALEDIGRNTLGIGMISRCVRRVQKGGRGRGAAFAWNLKFEGSVERVDQQPALVAFDLRPVFVGPQALDGDVVVDVPQVRRPPFAGQAGAEGRHVLEHQGGGQSAR